MANIWNFLKRNRIAHAVAGQSALVVKSAEVAPEASLPRLTNRICPLQIPLPFSDDEPWKPHFLFAGSTATIRRLTCHASVLAQHRSPHPPHAHDEEEVLLVLDGAVDVLLPNEQLAKAEQQQRLRPGHLVYYPAHFRHTLQTVSEHPANYLMFKWHTDRVRERSPLAFDQFDLFDPGASAEIENGFRASVLFEGATAYLEKLHCHVSTLTPGAGYDPHVDAHDVAIVVWEGEVETLGQRLRPHGVIFHPAGEPHGMRNPGTTTATYAVFEFHG
jgi:mannose-6-phosphate isomerase-like protein (cupin superfamily)